MAQVVGMAGTASAHQAGPEGHDQENDCEPAWNIDPLAGVIGVQH
jgi:hypothetical protein